SRAARPPTLVRASGPSLVDLSRAGDPPGLRSLPTRRSSDLTRVRCSRPTSPPAPRPATRAARARWTYSAPCSARSRATWCSRSRSEEHTSELQSRENLVCRLLLEKKNKEGGRHADEVVRVSA